MTSATIDAYSAFLASKRIAANSSGFTLEDADINPKLFPFQRDIVRWAVARGRAAIFAECGLGKTPMQLEWARHVVAETGGNVLILAPLAVAQQTVHEGEKFGVTVRQCRLQSEVQPGITITNYDNLDKFDSQAFVGVVLDESGILKSYMGVTKQKLVERFASTRFRLCCTATPAPNDVMEIGNHAEFLSIMQSGEMLARWFINDTMAMGHYRLKRHAEALFWDWVATWAVSLIRPSDIGYSDDGFILPALNLREVFVPVDRTVDRGDRLFRDRIINATTMHKEMRLTAPARAKVAADLINGNDEYWVAWCNTNYEADELRKLIPGAVEVRGSESAAEKERKLTAFTRGEVRVMITKPLIAGFGLNWQHCHNAAFVGLSFSFEQMYQAVRRHYRFGQEREVNAVIILAETEESIAQIVMSKMAEHEKLMAGMTASSTKLHVTHDQNTGAYLPTSGITVPSWLHTKEAIYASA